MKHRLTVIISAVLAVSILIPGGVVAFVDQPAPRGAAMSSALLKAEDFHLEDYRGKVVLLDFWASWCEPCKQSLPWLQWLQRAYGKDGLVVVPVNLDRDSDKARAMLASLDSIPVRVVDPGGKLAERYELQGMPTSILIDRQGGIAARHTGFLPAGKAAREKEIRDLLAKGRE